MSDPSQPTETAKIESLKQFQVEAGEQLTSNQEVALDNTDNIKSGCTLTNRVKVAQVYAETLAP
jgi:hypothetical protein